MKRSLHTQAAAPEPEPEPETEPEPEPETEAQTICRAACDLVMLVM
jgi:hypothetical protein